MSNTYLNPTQEQLRSLMQKEYNGPVYMLNLLKYKDEVDGRTGKEVYREYMSASRPFIEKANAEVIFYGNPMASLIGPTENEWDKVMIVKYNSTEEFAKMIKSDDYPHHIRTSALADSRLICISK